MKFDLYSHLLYLTCALRLMNKPWHIDTAAHPRVYHLPATLYCTASCYSCAAPCARAERSSGTKAK